MEKCKRKPLSAWLLFGKGWVQDLPMKAQLSVTWENVSRAKEHYQAQRLAFQLPCKVFQRKLHLCKHKAVYHYIGKTVVSKTALLWFLKPQEKRKDNRKQVIYLFRKWSWANVSWIFSRNIWLGFSYPGQNKISERPLDQVFPRMEFKFSFFILPAL